MNLKLSIKHSYGNIKYMKNDKILRHAGKYNRHIKSCTDIRDYILLKMDAFRSLDEIYSRPHLGSQV